MLTFENGDRLQGEFLRKENGTIIFKSDMLGELRIDEAKVKLELEQPASPPKRVVQEPKPVPQPKPAPKPVATPKPRTVKDLEEEDEELPLLPEDFFVLEFIGGAREYFLKLIPDNWHGRISAGYDFDNSTNESEKITLKLQVNRKWEDWQLKSSWFYNFKETRRIQQNDVIKNQDKYGGDLSLRYDVLDDVFLQYGADYEQDNVRDTRHEVDQSLGIGYRLIDEERLEFNLLTSGLAEFRDVNPTVKKWTGRSQVSEELEYHLNRLVRFTHEAYFGVNPLDTEDTTYGWNAKLFIRMTKWIETIISYERDFDNILRELDARDEERIILSFGIPF